MPTSQLGLADSYLGNIVLGTGGSTGAGTQVQVSETVTLSESLGSAAFMLEGVSEDVPLVETGGAWVGIPQAVGESYGFSEECATVWGTSLQLGTNLDLQESIDQGFGGDGLMVFEGVTLQQGVSIQKSTFSSVVDSLVLQEEASLPSQASVTVSDTLTLTEGVLAKYQALSALSENVVMSATYQGTSVGAISFVEAISLLETFGSPHLLTLAVGDNLEIDESVSAQASLRLTVSSALPLPAEGFSHSQTLGATATETLALSETIGFERWHPVPLIETVSLSDQLLMQQHGAMVVSEDPALIEGASYNQTLRSPLTETLTLSDAIDFKRDYPVPVSETVNLSDLTLVQQQKLVSISEDPDLSEGLAFESTRALLVAEALNLAEGTASNTVSSPRVTENLGLLGESLATCLSGEVTSNVQVSLIENIRASRSFPIFNEETITLNVGLTTPRAVRIPVQEALLSIVSAHTESTFYAVAVDPNTIELNFPQEIQVEGTGDLAHYSIVCLGSGIPVQALNAEPVQRTLNSGYNAQVAGPGSISRDLAVTLAIGVGDYFDLDSPEASARDVRVTAVLPEAYQLDRDLPVALWQGEFNWVHKTANRQILNSGSNARLLEDGVTSRRLAVALSAQVGDYFDVVGKWQNVSRARVEAVTEGLVTLNEDLIVADSPGTLTWTHRSGVSKIRLTTTECTSNVLYEITAHLKNKNGVRFKAKASFVGLGLNPTLVSVEYLPDEGALALEFSEPLAVDRSLTDPSSYTITGPTAVRVRTVQLATDRRVMLYPLGLESGVYQVSVVGPVKDHSLNIVL